MNKQQAASYNAIKEGYKNDPRWIHQQQVLKDPLSDSEETTWAQARCAELERSCARSAEQARVAGL